MHFYTIVKNLTFVMFFYTYYYLNCHVAVLRYFMAASEDSASLEFYISFSVMLQLSPKRLFLYTGL